jgi:surfeit locus 1 family protein
MLQRLRQAGLIWPTVLAMAGLAVLIGLGTWQLERKRWKEDLLAKIAARTTADPIALARAVSLLTAGGDVDYLHVWVSGTFHHDKERYLYAPSPTGLGWHVYTPLELAPGRVIWVNRGTVPDDRKDPARRLTGQLEGESEVRGLVRIPPGRTMFTPGNDASGNLWYWADVSGMTASVFGPRAVVALPFVVEADAQPLPPGGLPRGGVTRLALSNRHLEYALTWYGIAATLIGVYSAFVINRLRSFSSQ